MGWAARRNVVAQEAAAGRIQPRVKKAVVSKREDEWLTRWRTMWERVHGIRVDIQPRIDPSRKAVA